MVFVDAVNTCCTVLAHVTFAVVYIYGTVGTFEARKTLTGVIGVVINASGVVLAGVEFVGAKWYFGLTVITHETCLALALIGVDEIDAGSVILTLILGTIVYVRLASQTSESRGAHTTEPALLEYFARGVVPARISIAGVYHEFAILAVISRRALTGVIPLWLGDAVAAVATGKRVTCIAFGQDIVAHFTFAYKS